MDIDRIGVTVGEAARDEQRQRLATLLLTVPGWKLNYTETTDTAGWLIRMGEKVGWHVSVATRVAEPSPPFRSSCDVPNCPDHRI